MKIRMDFVTNSSSSSFVFYGIYSPELSELLEKCQRYDWLEACSSLELESSGVGVNRQIYYMNVIPDHLYLDRYIDGYGYTELMNRKDIKEMMDLDCIISSVKSFIKKESYEEYGDQIEALIEKARLENEIECIVKEGQTDGYDVERLGYFRRKNQFQDYDEFVFKYKNNDYDKPIIKFKPEIWDKLYHPPINAQGDIAINIRSDIAEKVFQNTEAFHKVNFEYDVVIGANAFENCTLLHTLEFSDRVGYAEIGDCAFKNCKNIKNIIFPYSLEKLGKYAFENCIGLESVDIDCQWLKEIPEGMFKGCTSLKTVILPSGVRKINKSAFEGCVALEKVIFKGVMEEISDDAFKGCVALKDFPQAGIKYGEDVWADPIHNNYRYSKVRTENRIKIHRYMGSDKCAVIPDEIDGLKVGYLSIDCFDKTNKVECVHLPDSLIEFNTVILKKLKKLKYVRLPSCMNRIPEISFAGLSNLKGIYIPENVSAIYTEAFKGCKSLENVYLANGKGVYANALNTEHSPNLVIRGLGKSLAEKFAKRIKAPFKADSRDRETIETRLLAEAQGQVFDDGFWDYEETEVNQLLSDTKKLEDILKIADDDYSVTGKRPENITQFVNVVNSTFHIVPKLISVVHKRDAVEWLIENGYIVPMTVEDKLAEILAELKKRYPEGSELLSEAKDIQQRNEDLQWDYVKKHLGTNLKDWLIANGLLLSNADVRKAKKDAHQKEVENREAERQAQKLARLEELRKVEKRDESVLQPADLKLLNNTLEKLEQYYPEHKVFATDSICENVRSAANKLTKKLGYSAFDEFLYVYGYENISGREVYETRKYCGYTPGNEPELVKQRVDNSIAKLEELYPDCIIEGAIRHKNESLEYTVMGLYQWLGYENLEAFLLAYGFVYVVSAGHKQTFNPNEVIFELLKRYPDGTTTKALQLVDENPDLPMMLVYKNSNRDFGMSLQKYLEQVGIILGKKTTPEEAKVNRESEKERIEEGRKSAAEEKAAEEARIAQLVEIAKANRIAYKQNRN